MPIPRRTMLTGLVLVVAGCANDPVISGSPALAPSPPAPTQAAEDASAQTAVAGLRLAVGSLTTASDGVGAGWMAAALGQCDAQLAVLALPDPFGAQDQTPFPVTSPSPTAATGMVAVDAAVDAAVRALDAAAAVADDPGVRLMHASAAAGAVALRDVTLVPDGQGPVPVRLQATTVAASLPIALGHAWALIYGLGVGLGRLGAKDPLHALGTARLAEAKALRNELREAMSSAPEQPAAFELPNAMATVDEIRAGWAELETALLDGFARMVAASAEATWRQRMREQVPAVQAVGGRLGFWPGWTR